MYFSFLTGLLKSFSKKIFSIILRKKKTQYLNKKLIWWLWICILKKHMAMQKQRFSIFNTFFFSDPSLYMKQAKYFYSNVINLLSISQRLFCDIVEKILNQNSNVAIFSSLIILMATKVQKSFIFKALSGFLHIITKWGFKILQDLPRESFQQSSKKFFDVV